MGRAIATALAEAGCDVALHYHNSRDEAEELAGIIRSAGRRCEIFRCDLNDTSQIPGLIESVFAAFPGCNILVNNASVFEPGGFQETDAADFDRNFNVNLKAPLFLSKEFALRCECGRIVNILDMRVARTVTDHFAYTLAKKALGELTKMSALALAPRIRVNAVCPGLILPPEDDDAAKADFGRLTERVPLKTRGRAEDVAQAVLFLLQSEFITGQAIFVDGGESLR